MNNSDPLPFQTEVSSLLHKLSNNLNEDLTFQLPLIVGQYCLIRLLGRGGMGDVYEAENIPLKRREAIKFVRSKLLLNSQAIERFQTEIESTAKLHHPNIVSVYNAGQYEGRPYMVMEFLEGQTVQQYVRRKMELGEPLTVKEAVNIVIQAAQGLQYAHEKGVVHRDVKPGNLWIDSDGKVKVLDLGLALAAADDDAKKHTVGTPDFMSPEQCSPQGTVNPRSDVYSLGCTLFYILTGTVPFCSEEFSTPEKKMEAQAQRVLPPLSAYRKGIPNRVQKTLNRMTAKDAANRYASMKEVIEALSPNPAGWKRIASAAAVVIICSAVAWGLSVKNKIVDVPSESGVEKQINPDVTGAFPAGKQAGDKLIRVVNGVEYVFRWCPPGSFLMGKHGIRITNDMSVDELLKIAKDNKLLDDNQIHEFESRHEELKRRNSVTDSIIQQETLKIDLDFLKNDVYHKLSFNSKVNAQTPPVETTIRRGFWILDCEVTRQMWFSVMPDSSANGQIRTLNELDYVPVRMVNWQDAQDFCTALSEKIGDKVELPSETQWEYACRAGEDETPFETMSAQSVSFKDMLSQPKLIRSKAPNAWGIYDMPGNVQEICSDEYVPDRSDSQTIQSHSNAENSPLLYDQQTKTLRGGCYLNNLELEDFFSVRNPLSSGLRAPSVGFRLCVEPGK